MFYIFVCVCVFAHVLLFPVPAKNAVQCLHVLLVNKLLIVCSCVCVCRNISVNSWRSRDSRRDFRDSCSRSTHTSSHCSSSSNKTRNHRCTTTARTQRTTNQPGLERYTWTLLKTVVLRIELSQYKFSCFVSQVEERSKLNRQGSPKICTTVSDTNIQSRSESISQSGASQTPPMQRPVEPQGGQGKVCNLSFYSLCISAKSQLSYSARMQC